MEIKDIHAWDVSPPEAIDIQEKLKEKIDYRNKVKSIKKIAAADCAYECNSGVGAVVVCNYPQLAVIEERVVRQQISFPYIPGLLTFREGPLILETIKKLQHKPDLFYF